MTTFSKAMAAAGLLALATGCDLTVQAGSADGGPDGGADAGTDAGSDGGTVTTLETTPLTLGGYTLTPQSSIMAASIGNFGPLSSPALLVYVSDFSALCAGYGCSVASTGFPAGTHFYLQLFGSDPKTYSVSDTPAAGVALASFLKAGSGGQTIFSDLAESGTVTLEAYSANGAATGSYDLKMKKGGTLKGRFHSSYCKGMTLNIPMGGVVCAETGDTASCQNPCTCDGKTVKAACTSTGTNQWSCTCTSATGAGSTCQMNGPNAVPPNGTACWSYGTCCPMKF